MKLSVVIPCLNAEATLAEQLEALAKQEWGEPWEVVFADNGSTDSSLEIARRFQKELPNLRIVDASERRGQPFALNTGAENARGESLAFCDADDVVGEGWVAAMGDALLKHEFVACRTDDRKLNPRWLWGSRGKHQSRGLQKIWYPPYLPHAGGGTLGVRKRHFERVGGFDEGLPYLHDTDFCFKLQLSGVELDFVPDAVMHLRFRDSAWGLYRQSLNYGEYNVLVSRIYASKTRILSRRWQRYALNWLRLVGRLHALRSREGRLAWMGLLGGQVGRLRGVLKYRVPPV